MKLSAPRLALPLLVAALWACGADAPDAAPPETPETRELGPVDGRELASADLDRLQVGDTAPDFSLESYGGDIVTLSDFRGRKDVVLVFYRGHW